MRDDDEVLREIQRLARADRFRLTFHVEFVRMPERGATPADIRRALVTATCARWQPDHETWKVTGGLDLDGDDLTLAVVVEADVVVVTLF